MHPKLRGQQFVTIALSLDADSATVSYTDGNDKVLYRQSYEVTDARKEFTMYYTGGVLMLAQEY
jgi:hypothetical protein